MIGHLRAGLAPRTLFAVALVAGLGLLVLPPIGLLVYTSLRTGRPGTPGAGWTLDNWTGLAHGDNLEAIGNTLLIGVVTTVFAVPLAFFFAWVEVQTDTPLARRLSGLVLIPLVFSPFLTTIAWTILLAPRAGLLNSLAADLLPVERIFDVYSVGGMVFILTQYFVAIAYLAIRGALRTVDASVFDAARASGAPLHTVLRRVVIPLLTPALAGAALLTFTLNIGLFSVVTLLGPTARVDTLQLDVYFSMVETPTNPPHAAVVGVFLLVVTLVNLVLYRRLLRRPKRYVTVTGRGFRPAKVRLGRWRYAMLAALVLYVTVASVLPYLALVYAAVSPFLGQGVNLDNLGLRNFDAFFGRAEMVTGLWNTAKLVVIGALVTTVVSFAVGYLTSRMTGRLSRTLESLAVLPLAVPTLSLALGVLWFALSFGWARDHVYGGLVLIYLAQLVHFLPVGVQVVASGIVQLGPDVEDAARSCGAGGPARMRRVVVPLLRPSLASAWIILALYTSVEAGLSIFLFSGQSVTTAVNVFNNALHGLPNIMYAGALILATFGLVAIAVGNKIFGTSKYLSGSSGQ